MGQAAKIIEPERGAQVPAQILKISQSQDIENVFNRLQYLNARIGAFTEAANKSIAEIRNVQVFNVTPLETEKTMLEELMQDFAEKNRSIFPKESKTLDFRGGSISFVQGAGSVELKQSKRFKSLKDVVKAIQEKKWTKLLRKKDPEVDKVAVKKWFDSEKIDDKGLASIGLEIKREEKFHYELKTAEK